MVSYPKLLERFKVFESSFAMIIIYKIELENPTESQIKRILPFSQAILR